MRKFASTSEGFFQPKKSFTQHTMSFPSNGPPQLPGHTNPNAGGGSPLPGKFGAHNNANSAQYRPQHSGFSTSLPRLQQSQMTRGGEEQRGGDVGSGGGSDDLYSGLVGRSTGSQKNLILRRPIKGSKIRGEMGSEVGHHPAPGKRTICK